MKEKLIGSPEQFLRIKVSQVVLENIFKCWIFSSSQHGQNTAKSAEEYRYEDGVSLLTKAKSPWPSSNRLEIDITTEITTLEALCCRSFMGMLS